MYVFNVPARDFFVIFLICGIFVLLHAPPLVCINSLKVLCISVQFAGICCNPDPEVASFTVLVFEYARTHDGLFGEISKKCMVVFYMVCPISERCALFAAFHLWLCPPLLSPAQDLERREIATRERVRMCDLREEAMEERARDLAAREAACQALQEELAGREEQMEREGRDLQQREATVADLAGVGNWW